MHWQHQKHQQKLFDTLSSSIVTIWSANIFWSAWNFIQMWPLCTAAGRSWGKSLGFWCRREPSWCPPRSWCGRGWWTALRSLWKKLTNYVLTLHRGAKSKWVSSSKDLVQSNQIHLCTVVKCTKIFKPTLYNDIILPLCNVVTVWTGSFVSLKDYSISNVNHSSKWI